MLLAPTPIKEAVQLEARRFLEAIAGRDYDLVWNYLTSLSSIEMISTASVPLWFYSNGMVDEVLQSEQVDGLSFSFQIDAILSPDDAVGIRTGFFDGIRHGLESMGWLEGFLEEECYVFLNDGNAVLFADSLISKKSIILPMVLDQIGLYRVDLEGLTVFSMTISAQKLHKYASRTYEAGELKVALEIYEMCARLNRVYSRLKALTWSHGIVGKGVTDERKVELDAEYGYTLLAKVMVDEILSDPRISVPGIDLTNFLEATFNGYGHSLDSQITNSDMEALMAMDDSALRLAIAEILVGVNRVEARREARKPHTSAEIADMEVLVRHGDDLRHLMMPVKSGREIRQTSVPVEVFYQILRPHMFFKHGVVVFITAKPCSQFLMNYIKQARDSIGWPIEVIEGEDLARLLKTNGQLSGSNSA